MSDEMNLDNAPGWLPEVGEVLVGRIVDVAKGWSDQAEKYYPIVVIEPEKPVRIKDREKSTDEQTVTVIDDSRQPVAVHCFHTVLYNRMVELKPTIGERIGIKYVEATKKDKAKGSKGNTPSKYNVKVDGRAADVWGVMQQDAREVAARAANALPPNTPQQPLSDTPDAPSEDDIPF